MASDPVEGRSLQSVGADLGTIVLPHHGTHTAITPVAFLSALPGPDGSD
jgi:hypothetical protein